MVSQAQHVIAISDRPTESLEAITEGLEKLLGYPSHGGKLSQSDTVFVTFQYSNGSRVNLEVRRDETAGELKARLQVFPHGFWLRIRPLFS
jgi:hypothetical protein